MSIVLVALASVLGLAAAGSALGKLRNDPKVVDPLRAVGVKDSQIPVLAALELIGAVGLFVGIWLPAVGLAAAIGLAVFFLGAVISHLRVKASAKETAPAAILMLIALATVALEALR